MENKIPEILSDRGLTISDLHAMIIRGGDRFSYTGLLELAKPTAGPLADGVKIGTLRKIAFALGVKVRDLIGEE